MGEFFGKIYAWLEATQVRQQVAEVDYIGLLSNPWFLVPFVLTVLYLIYKQAIVDLIIVGIFVAVWWLSGTEYMDTLVIGNKLQIDKILPVLFGAAGVLGFVIYLFFGRSD